MLTRGGSFFACATGALGQIQMRLGPAIAAPPERWACQERPAAKKVSPRPRIDCGRRDATARGYAKHFQKSAPQAVRRTHDGLDGLALKINGLRTACTRKCTQMFPRRSHPIMRRNAKFRPKEAAGAIIQRLAPLDCLLDYRQSQSRPGRGRWPPPGPACPG